MANEPHEPQPDRVVVYKDDAGEWRWRAVAGNNEPVAASGEGYVNQHHALAQAHNLFPGVTVVVEEERRNG